MQALWDSIILFCNTNRMAVFLGLIVLSGLAYAKPKPILRPILRLISLFLILGAIYYFLSMMGQMTFSGIEQTSRIARKEMNVKEL